VRQLYTLVLTLLTPIVLLRLAWRGCKARDYWRRWPQRFGFFPALPSEHCLWIHAVSFGEVQAAAPLIRHLLNRAPEQALLITTTTPTGSAHVQRLFSSELGKTVHHVYLPYDLPGSVQRFLRRTRPRLAIMVETEIWPNLFHHCRDRQIPLIVANARLSQRSAAGYARFAALTRQTLQNITTIAAQDHASAQRFIELGATAGAVQITGSIKFDIELAPNIKRAGAALRRQWGTRPVWVAASTHPGEEEQVLAAHRHVQMVLPDALLILVPRHPERFRDAETLCHEQRFDSVLRSSMQSCSASTAVFIGDSMGELMLFYAASDVAFVGGSLVPIGGHNPIEPAALGLPIITGPHLFNFAEISQTLATAGAARQIENAQQLGESIAQLLQERETRHAMGEQGLKIVAENRGALDRLMALIIHHDKRDKK